MKLRWTIAAQLLATAGQLLIDPLPVGHEWKPWLHGVLGFAQFAAALIAHHSNPDGTPARVAYEK